MIRKSLLTLAATLAVGAAQAATFNFTGVVDFSSTGLLNSAISGQFSVADTEVAALVGGFGEVDIQALQLTFLGQSYQLSSPADAYAVYEDGQVVGPNASFMTSDGGTLALQSFFGASNFTYTAINGESSGALAITAAVPEPSTWALTIAGLALVGGLARRRQRAAA